MDSVNGEYTNFTKFIQVIGKVLLMFFKKRQQKKRKPDKISND